MLNDDVEDDEMAEEAADVGRMIVPPDIGTINRVAGVDNINLAEDLSFIQGCN
jgi:hypothetical protein